ncbi:MAG: acetyl-CoA carboxylase biotin carboxylase subunit [Acidobacteriota bacterium]|nr:acetyl-CoA carboxylase biotin carboxylase subunit [Acidobacteriota bacterium]
MFEKILIANRGEIALRVIQACRELGIATVAVHSTADENSLHVTYADEDVCIGPPPAKDSYLDISAIVSAAEITGADAIHPGYGFLAESAYFAEVLAECGLAWIGPKPETIRLMGDKAKARETAAVAGVPILPGSQEPLSGPELGARLADDIGYPVILKAAAGGGGRGMRIVGSSEEFDQHFVTASAEATAAFGDGSMYLEKYLTAPRHIEVQVMADTHGRAVHLGERECSIQRRHQKLIEESPSPALNAEMRREITQAALRLTRHVDYHNVGTVEFLLDEDGSFYFMEMNTRVQVEHPVTEMVTGVDIVKEQIAIAAGRPLSIDESRAPTGHAIECRVNAENPRTFIPSAGRLQTFHTPGGPGIRVDTHSYEGYDFPPFYDSLIAKVVAFGNDREESRLRMLRALEFFEVQGVDTTIPLHRKVLAHEGFIAGDFTTGFLDRMREEEG